MNKTTYGYSTEVGMNFQTAIQKTTELLKGQGFGIMTTIDAQAKMKEKLDIDIEPYIILGACNPSMAHKALQTETEIGLLLPCNVIVYQKDGQVHVSAIRPTQAMSMIDNPELRPMAEDIEQKLKSVIESL